MRSKTSFRLIVAIFVSLSVVLCGIFFFFEQESEILKQQSPQPSQNVLPAGQGSHVHSTVQKNAEVPDHGMPAEVLTPQIFVFYFPQYHPIPENDMFWGKGFTEWNLVRKCLSEQSPYLDYISPSKDVGFYDLRDKNVRKNQGLEAKSHGIDGFIYYHYWFGDNPVMAEVLERLLQDGEPKLKFCLCWANENWSRRWDGGNKEILLEQTYSESSTRKHFEFLKRFWSHELHLRKNRNHDVPFFIYMTDVGKNSIFLFKTVGKWKKWWNEETGGKLIVSQVLGSPGQHKVVSWVDGVAEFEPSYSASKDVIYEKNRFQRIHQCQYPGVFAGWDNAPRHINGGGNRVTNNLHNFHSSLMYALQSAESMGAITPPTCFNLVLATSWNEWGERNVLEPDLISGNAKLRQIKRAVQKFNSGKMTKNMHRKDSVCFVVRTYSKHRNDPLFNISTLMHSLQALPFTWEAHLLVTEENSTSYKKYLENAFGYGGRIHVPEIPAELPRAYDPCLSAYHITDWGVRQCSEETEWVVATNGDNSYGRNSFQNLLFSDESIDIVLIPTMSRYYRWNYFRSEKNQMPNCEAQFKPFANPVAQYGVVDLGGVALRRIRLVEENVFFAEQYPRKCSSLDWFTLKGLLDVGWRYLALAPPADDFDSFFMHNPNPWTCARLGGIWQDSADFESFGCLRTEDVQVEKKDIISLHENGEKLHCVKTKNLNWGVSPSDLTKCNNVVEGIASKILHNAKQCGLKFDEGFYGMDEKAEHHWVKQGFCQNLDYRFLRTESFDQALFLSERCFVVRSFANRKIVSQPRHCHGVNVLQRMFCSEVAKTCNLVLDENHYLASHKDVQNSGMKARVHFWENGVNERRDHILLRDETKSVAAGFEDFCRGLSNTPFFEVTSWSQRFLSLKKTLCIQDSSLDLFSTNNCGMAVNMVLIPNRTGHACVTLSKSKTNKIG